MNQSGRMEKTREALRYAEGIGVYSQLRERCVAALAEVEEWEAEHARLKAALDEALGRLGSSEPFSAQDYRCLGIEDKNILRAALVPADRNTT